MESENKRRSGSFGSQKATQTISSDEAKKLSQSEESMVDNVSPGSSEAGTLKKPRKFKPRKFIAKRFKLKKSEKSNDEQESASGQSEQESTKKSVTAKLSEKLSSPKLQRFNFVKRFSGTKSYKVTPIDDEVGQETSNLRNLETESLGEVKVKKSDLNVDDDIGSETSTEFVVFEEPGKEISQIDIPISESSNVVSSANTSASSAKESVTLESKKVQLKITISGKKVEKGGTPSPTERVVDKASSPSYLSAEPLQKQTDIILPSTSTQVRLSTSRDHFFKSIVARDDEVNGEQSVNPISKDYSANTPATFAGVVKDGLSVKSTPLEGSNEVEKYLILTSSLNTIISAAKELHDLSVENLNFPQFPELKIREATTDLEEPSSESAPPKIVAVEEKVYKQVGNISENFASSTPIKAKLEEIDESAKLEEIDESEEMRKQGKNSRIPIIDNHRVTTSLDEKEITPTVRTQEAHRPYHLNLSSSSSEGAKPNILMTNEIKFEVGTPVRPQRTSPAASTSNLTPLALSEIPTSEINSNDSIDDSFHSPESEQSLTQETTRRRIAYVPQLTIYTAEEQELLKSNIQANASESFDTSSLPPDNSMFPVFDDSVTNTMTSSPDKREHLYKILVIGELGTGKTSFIKRYVHQFFSNNYRATIGVDFALKVLNWDQSTIIRLQLWDIAGQERFGNMTRVYYKEAVGAFIVFDVTRSATFDAVLKWKSDLDQKVSLPDGSQIPCILLANKCDQQKQGLVAMPAKMDEYCKQHGFAGWFETSAKDNVNIEESAKALVSKILINDKLIHNDTDGGTIVLNAEEAENQKKKFCSC